MSEKESPPALDPQDLSDRNADSISRLKELIEAIKPVMEHEAPLIEELTANREDNQVE
jgi:hypothetical protein